jgi:transposase
MAWSRATRARYETPRGSYTSDLSEPEWAVLEPMLPPPARTGRRRKHGLRRIVEAILYVVVGGCQWRNLPKEFPPRQTVQEWFYQWRDSGLWRRIHHTLLLARREALGRLASPSAGVMDAQSVRTVEGGPCGYDAGKKVWGRKRNAVVDTQGDLLELAVTAANVQDWDAACGLMRKARRLYPWLARIWADSSYAAEKTQDAAQILKLVVEIVRRCGDVRGFVVLPRRWVVERTFAWLNRCRRLTKDFERSIPSAEAWIWIAAVRLQIRRAARG